MNQEPQSWTLVVFCFNEVNTLAKVVFDAREILKRISPGKSQIIIVDDGSTDGSADVANGLARKFDDVQAILHGTNRGIGHALRSGYFAADCENVCAIPADSQFNVSELLPFAIVPFKSVISFYRQRNEVYSGYRRLLSFINRSFNELILGLDLRDVNWVKVYKTAELPGLNLRLTSSLIESEICAKLRCKQWRFIEVESEYRPREAGLSRGGSLTTVFRAFREIFRLAKSYFSFKMGDGAKECFRRKPS